MKETLVILLLVIASCTPAAEKLYNEDRIRRDDHYIILRYFGGYQEKIDMIDSTSTLYEYKVECNDHNRTTMMVLPHFNEIWYYHGANAPFEILKFKRGRADVLVDTIMNSTTLDYYQTKKLVEVVNRSVGNNIQIELDEKE